MTFEFSSSSHIRISVVINPFTEKLKKSSFPVISSSAGDNNSGRVKVITKLFIFRTDSKPLDRKKNIIYYLLMLILIIHGNAPNKLT